jgi:hypothetical protein
MLSRSEVIEWIRDLFPPAAKFEVSQKSEDVIVRIDWPVAIEGSSETMPSRRIHLRISKESFDDYLYRDEYKNSARELLREFIQAKMSKFSESYKREKYPEPPTESWQVTTNVFAIL